MTKLEHENNDFSLEHVNMAMFQYALHVYDILMSAGKDYGVRNAGYYALRHLRIENFFAYWGLDLDDRTTPMECGRGYRVKFDVCCFLGFFFLALAS